MTTCLYHLVAGPTRWVAQDDPREAFGRLADRALMDPQFDPGTGPGRVIARQGASGHRVPWGPAAWDALHAACAAAAPAAGSGRTLCVWPDGSGVLSDAPSTRSWLDRRAPEGFELLLDPAAWITPSMRGHAPDHLERIFEQLGGHPRVVGVMLPAPPGSGDPLADAISAAVGALDRPLPMLLPPGEACPD